MQQPWCSRGAGAIFSRQSLRFGDVSSGFLQFVAMPFNGDRHRDALLPYAAPNADPVQRRLTYPPTGHLLSHASTGRGMSGHHPTN